MNRLDYISGNIAISWAYIKKWTIQGKFRKTSVNLTYILGKYQWFVLWKLYYWANVFELNFMSGNITVSWVNIIDLHCLSWNIGQMSMNFTILRGVLLQLWQYSPFMNSCLFLVYELEYVLGNIGHISMNWIILFGCVIKMHILNFLITHNFLKTKFLENNYSAEENPIYVCIYIICTLLFCAVYYQKNIF